MSKIKAVATAIAAVFTAAPLAAENDGDYQFIISGDPVAAATEGSSSASSVVGSLTGGPLADGTVFATSLEGRYRTRDDSPTRKLRSDKFRSTIMAFR